MKQYKHKRKAKMFIVPYIQNFRDYWAWLEEERIKQQQDEDMAHAVEQVLEDMGLSFDFGGGW